MKLCFALLATLGVASATVAEEGFQTLETFGEALFFDENLSFNRTQSCSTCHDPDKAFTNARLTDAGQAVSLGDDGISLGDRSAPTLGYAAFTPEFYRNEKGRYIGGFFWDGRASTLATQAGEPVLNPIEMGMPDKASVAARLNENADYLSTLKSHFGQDVLETPEGVFEGMARAIAAFERTQEFAPFDSKYDRFLKGEAELSLQEETGRSLFFARDKTNCSVCHQFRANSGDAQETFSTYRYHNTGVPTNPLVRSLNGLNEGHIDVALLGNPAVDQAAETGRFKVPTLRNVAVTAPYMHNGVFQNLRTVVLFYNKYNSLDPLRQVNPETGQTWRLPEVTKTLAVSDLIKGKDLSDIEVDALVAFLKALTDARYEHLLKDGHQPD